MLCWRIAVRALCTTTAAVCTVHGSDLPVKKCSASPEDAQEVTWVAAVSDQLALPAHLHDLVHHHAKAEHIRLQQQNQGQVQGEGKAQAQQHQELGRKAAGVVLPGHHPCAQAPVHATTANIAINRNLAPLSGTTCIAGISITQHALTPIHDRCALPAQGLLADSPSHCTAAG